MKTLSLLIQSLALTACLSMHLVGPGELRMPGLRRALQTISVTSSQQTATAFMAIDAGQDV